MHLIISWIQRTASKGLSRVILFADTCVCVNYKVCLHSSIFICYVFVNIILIKYVNVLWTSEIPEATLRLATFHYNLRVQTIISFFWWFHFVEVVVSSVFMITIGAVSRSNLIIESTSREKYTVWKIIKRM